MSVRLGRSALVLAMLATLATACAGSEPDDAGSDPTVEPSAVAPPKEGTGDEPPAPGGEGQPALGTAGAPIGNGGTYKIAGTLCVYVKWLGQGDAERLDQTTRFKVTEVIPSGVEPAGSSCPDPCQGYIFDNANDQCTYAVGPGSVGGTLALRGQVLCSAPPQDCEKFRSSLELITITIEPPEENGEESGEPEPSEPPEPSEAPEPESSGPAEQPSPAE